MTLTALPAAPERGAIHSSLARVVCATCGSLLTSLITTPLEVVKTRMQTVLPPLAAAPARPLASACATALAIARTEGVASLWSGLSLSLAMQVPSTVLYFQLYDGIRERLVARGDPLVSLLAPMASGIAARAAVVTALSPLELVRTRAMAKDGEQGMLRALRAEVARGGVATLWRGWAPTLARDVPFSGIYWFGYERAKAALAPPLRAATGDAWASAYLASFLAGLSSGVVAALLTTPQDMVKTRRQVIPGGGSVWVILRDVHAAGGLRAVFAGGSMRCARVGPACAIMISTYEIGKRWLGVEDFSSN
jgi:solute carrier family 25 protein 39/40